MTTDEATTTMQSDRTDISGSPRSDSHECFENYTETSVPRATMNTPTEAIEINHDYVRCSKSNHKPRLQNSTQLGLPNWTTFTVAQFENLNPQIVIPIIPYPHQTKMITALLEVLRQDESLRRFWHQKKTYLSIRQQAHNDFFNTFEEEDFGDTVPVNSTETSFHSIHFDWENFTGIDDQFVGLSTEQKKAAIKWIQHYPKASTKVHLADRTKQVRSSFLATDLDRKIPATNKKRKADSVQPTIATRHSSRLNKTPRSSSDANTTTQPRSSSNGANSTAQPRQDLDSHNQPNSTNSKVRLAQIVAGPTLVYRDNYTKSESNNEPSNLPPGIYCSNIYANNSPNQCKCRYLIFNTNSFTTMLLPIFLLYQLEHHLPEGIETAMLFFTTIFGVTNVPSHCPSNGVRGFKYYFLCAPELGAFCPHAMRVLIGIENWNKISEYIADNSSNKGRNSNEDYVEEKRRDGMIVISNENLKAYTYVDLFNGYAAFLRTTKGWKKKDNTWICETQPSGSDCYETCIANGLQLPPIAPSLNTVKKNFAAAQNFLRRHDGSRNNDWSGKGPRQHSDGAMFRVANPKFKFLFQTSIDNVSTVITSIDRYHDIDVCSLALTNKASIATRHLSTCSTLMFGPGCMKHRMPLMKKSGDDPDWPFMTNKPSSKFIQSYCTGDFGNPTDSFLHSEYLFSYTDLATKAIEGTPRYRALFRNRKPADLDCYTSLAIKVTNKKGKGLIQEPHLIMNDIRLDAAVDVMLVRMIIPLDKSGSIITIWPKGKTNGTSRLVFIPHGTVLVLPLTVLTSNCLQFTPSRNPHAELVFAFFIDKRLDALKRKKNKSKQEQQELADTPPCLPHNVEFENHEYYYPGRKKGSPRCADISELANAKDKYPTAALQDFTSLFDALN